MKIFSNMRTLQGALETEGWNLDMLQCCRNAILRKTAFKIYFKIQKSLEHVGEKWITFQNFGK